MYFVYILRCCDGTLYTGITTDVKRRLKEHLGEGGKGAAYTRMKSPTAVEAVFSCEGRKDASKLEYYVKRLKKAEKEALIAAPETLDRLIPKLDCSLFTPVTDISAFSDGSFGDT